MKRLLVLILGCLLLAVSCKNTTDSVSSSEKPCPKLKIVNDTNQNNGTYIWKIELVNYKFEPLYILQGESQTFSLDKGMPAGNKDIYICIYIDSYNNGLQIKKNFTDGKTTTVRIYGYSGNYRVE